LSNSSTKKVRDTYPTKYIIDLTATSQKREYKACKHINIDDKLFEEAAKLAATENPKPINRNSFK